MTNIVYQLLDDLSQDGMDADHIAETPDIQPKLKYQPLDDLPHDKPDRLDAAHIAETREVLRSQLEAAIQKNNDKPLCSLILNRVKSVKRWHKLSADKTFLATLKALLRNRKRLSNPAIRIGLFGGLGQGKTSALVQATRNLTKPQSSFCFWKQKNAPVRSYWFDAAHYKADELEFEFDRIFSSWGMWARSSLINVVGFLLLLQIVIEFAIASFGDPKLAIFIALRFLPLGLVTGILGFRFLPFWLRDLERGNAFVDQNRAITRLFCRPDIFIVDNLDRANINQQVAILRALYKHSQALSTAFIICMDESSLLQSAITPEHPAKLLRKVINVELRLPARLPQDAPVLCQAILSKSLERNPKLSMLDDPVFAGDFATLVSLLPEFSPRIAKRILNDALVDAQKANLLNYAEDCGALLRLHMLYAAFPGLQQASLLLIRILECKEEQEQKRLITVLSEESKYEQSKLLRLINASHYVQPLAGNWKRLIGVHSHHQMTGGARALIKASPSIENQEMAQGLWESLNAILQGYGETELWKWYEDYCKSSTEFLPVVIWPMLVVMLAHSEQVEARLRLLRYYQKTLTVYESKLSDNKRHAHLHYALLRYWLADHQAFLSMPEQERTALVASIGALNDERKVYLLPIIDPAHVDFATVFELLAGHPSKDHRVIRNWLNQVSMNYSIENSYLGFDGSDAFLAAIWPTLPGDCLARGWDGKLKEQFMLFKKLNELSLLNSAPNSLVSSLFTEGNWRRLIAHDKAEQLLHSLQILLNFENRWSLKTWHLLFSTLSKEEKRKLVSDLIKAASSQKNSLWSAALLMACDANDEECIAILLKSVKALDSVGLVKLLIDPYGSGEYLLWTLASGEQIKPLLSALVAPSKNEWQQFKHEYNNQLTSCFSKCEDGAMLLEYFDLTIDFGEVNGGF